MDIAPLALVVLLGYGLLIAVSLTTWTAVAYFREDADVQHTEPEANRTRVEQERQRTRRQVSNDDVRGAKSRRARSGNDPFLKDAQGAASEPVSSSAGAVTTEPVSWKRETKAPEKAPVKPESTERANEEDAFERFLSSRSDDFDIR